MIAPPDLTHEQARFFLADLDVLYSRIEHEVLKPLEACQLAEGELKLLRRHVGTVWAWMVSDLQDPLWQRYPDLNPHAKDVG
jgi:hypothetical protein